MGTDLLHLRDAGLLSFEATVSDVDGEGRGVALDRTACDPTGGGRPHDTGTLARPASKGKGNERLRIEVLDR